MPQRCGADGKRRAATSPTPTDQHNQPTIYTHNGTQQHRFRKPAKKIPGKFGQRFYKNVGLGYKTPREAIEGTYIDKKCPFTGNVSIRGRILTGELLS